MQYQLRTLSHLPPAFTYDLISRACPIYNGPLLTNLDWCPCHLCSGCSEKCVNQAQRGKYIITTPTESTKLPLLGVETRRGGSEEEEGAQLGLNGSFVSQRPSSCEGDLKFDNKLSLNFAASKSFIFSYSSHFLQIPDHEANIPLSPLSPNSESTSPLFPVIGP